MPTDSSVPRMQGWIELRRPKRCLRIRLSHVCRDGLGLRCIGVVPDSSVPRMQGWIAKSDSINIIFIVCPTYAGMDCTGLPRPTHEHSLSHVCRDGLATEETLVGLSRSFVPRMQGWTDAYSLGYGFIVEDVWHLEPEHAKQKRL